MVDIFLSYASEDRETAGKVAQLLESAGWSVWWDRRIPAGETWRSMIERALADTRGMVVLWSKSSVVSEWVSEEAEEAKARGKPVVPALIEAVKPPLGWRQIQAIDLSDWDESHDAPNARQFIKDIEHLLGAGSGVRAENPLPHAGWRIAPNRALQWVALVLAGVGGVVGIGAYLVNGRPPEIALTLPAKPPPPPLSQPPASVNDKPERDVPQLSPTVTYVPIEPKMIETTLPVKINKNPPFVPTVPKLARCTRIMESAQLGTLSPEDRVFFQKECK